MLTGPFIEHTKQCCSGVLGCALLLELVTILSHLLPSRKCHVRWQIENFTISTAESKYWKTFLPLLVFFHHPLFFLVTYRVLLSHIADGDIAALGVLGAGVEDVRHAVYTADHRETGDDSFRPPDRTPALALERIPHDDEPLEREGHHVPDGQEAAHPARVRKQLAVRFARVDVYLEEAKPGDKQPDQVARVADAQRGQIVRGGQLLQLRVEEYQHGQNVTDAADHHQQRHIVEVEKVANQFHHHLRFGQIQRTTVRLHSDTGIRQRRLHGACV